MVQDYIPAVIPPAGQIVSIVLQMSTFGVLCVCFTRRTSWLKNWRALPLSIWLILLIYADSTLFVLATSVIVHGLGINSSRIICDSGIIVCLVFYASTKVMIYYFLVERAYVVRGSRKPRLRTKLWLFNSLFMMLPYIIVIILSFVWRFTFINEKGVCIIGMERRAMLPLITFEAIVNIYLTLLFILPLRKLYSYTNSTNPKLNRMAFRSLIGSLATLTASVANLTVLMILRGEPGWICLLCCNADILFCVLVLHWVTTHDKPTSHVSTPASRSGQMGMESSKRKEPRRQSRLSGTVPEKPGSRFVEEDVVLSSLERSQKGLSVWPYQHSPSSAATAKIPGSVTTEICRSYAHPPAARSKSKNGRVLHKGQDDTSECGDEVELHKIHVQSEVCIESSGESDEERMDTTDARSPSVEDAWGMKKSVSAEKIV